MKLAIFGHVVSRFGVHYCGPRELKKQPGALRGDAIAMSEDALGGIAQRPLAVYQNVPPEVLVSICSKNVSKATASVCNSKGSCSASLSPYGNIAAAEGP
ncbi:hypothetical protein [Paraburkholderia sp. J7]|uniref:hypothetical protein n=1 Tax=Paraburkholderia sp. J7 TaxID=2805438 RepID=UPI002AB7BA09|nr:hypothetical protein [Paraburkholderia sp. J7]